MRVAMLILVVVLSSACSDTDSTPTPEPDSSQSHTLKGRLSTLLLAEPGRCPEALTPGNLQEAVTAGFAEDAVERIAERTIEVRDGEGGEIGTATTAQVPRLVDANDRIGKYALCFAFARYSVTVPVTESYSIRVRGVPGSSEPISYETLEDNGFTCDPQIDKNGRLVNDPCLND
jgi:hypothetical protein